MAKRQEISIEKRSAIITLRGEGYSIAHIDLLSHQTVVILFAKYYNMAKEYSLADVKKHNNNEAAWIVIHNEVFDVTTYLYEHPGGEEVLLEQAGNDATEAFEDAGHSSDARELMQKYKVGDIIEAERKPYSDGKSTSQTNWKFWILPIATGVLASLICRFYIRSH